MVRGRFPQYAGNLFSLSVRKFGGVLVSMVIRKQGSHAFSLPAFHPFPCGLFLDEEYGSNVVGCFSEGGEEDRVGSLAHRSPTFPVMLFKKLDFLFCGAGRINHSSSVTHPRVMVIPFCGGYSLFCAFPFIHAVILVTVVSRICINAS